MSMTPQGSSSGFSLPAHGTTKPHGHRAGQGGPPWGRASVSTWKFPVQIADADMDIGMDMDSRHAFAN